MENKNLEKKLEDKIRLTKIKVVRNIGIIIGLAGLGCGLAGMYDSHSNNFAYFIATTALIATGTVIMYNADKKYNYYINPPLSKRQD
jgi:hypothetical protein